MGSIVLRLCRTSTPPANPPVGGCMPVNYCTLEEKKKRERRRRKREGDEEHRKKEKKRRRRSERERQRERSPLGCDYEMVCHRLRLQGCRQR